MREKAPMHKYTFTLFCCFLLLTTVIEAKPYQKLACDSIVQKGVREMSQKRHDISLELLVQAKDMAKKNKNYSCLFLSYNNIGANYYNLLDYGEALENFLKAYNIALKHLDETKEMVVLNNIAILYTKDSQPQKAKEYFLRAYKVAKKIKKENNIAKYAVNLGLVSNELEELSNAIQYFKGANLLIESDVDLKIQSQLGLVETYLLYQKPDDAINLMEPLLPKIKKEKNKDLLIRGYHLMAETYKAKQDYKTAIFYAQKSLDNSKDLENKESAYKLLVSLYKNKEDLEKTVQMQDSLLDIQTAIFSLKNGRLFETNKVKFEIQQFQQELLAKDKKLKAERKAYSIIIICTLLAILLIIYAWRNSKIKNEQRKAIIQQNKELLTLELEKEKSDHLLLEKKMKEQENLAKLEKKRLQLKVEKRNRKLMVTALKKGNKNEIIKNIIQSLSNHSVLKHNKDIKSYIKDLKKYLKSENEWDDFFKHFEEVNSSFIKTLNHKHPELNLNDIRFICYLYMNLSTKEIASLFNITPAACRKRKERIARKMKLENSGELTSYIFSI